MIERYGVICSTKLILLSGIRLGCCCCCYVYAGDKFVVLQLLMCLILFLQELSDLKQTLNVEVEQLRAVSMLLIIIFLKCPLSN